MYAAFGILTALHARGTTGRGQFIDVSMLEGQLGIMSTMIGAFVADGIVPGADGHCLRGACCRTRRFARARATLPSASAATNCGGPAVRCSALADAADDPRYVNNAARNANRSSLIELLQSVFETRTYEEWEAILLPAGIPMGAINTLDQVVAHPQVKARGVLVDCAHPVAGTVKMVGPPVRLSETPGRVRAPAPLLGQHTAAVLKERLGMTDQAIDALHRAGVIGMPTAR